MQGRGAANRAPATRTAAGEQLIEAGETLSAPCRPPQICTALQRPLRSAHWKRQAERSYAFDQNELRNGGALTLCLGGLVELRKIVASCLVEAIKFHNNIARARLPLKRLVTAASHEHATARLLQSLGRRRKDRVGFGVG
jgi:hypothetical protein